jgi:hypothetical protein
MIPILSNHTGAAESLLATYPNLTIVDGFDMQIVSIALATFFGVCVLVSIRAVSAIGSLFLVAVVVGIICIFAVSDVVLLLFR